jgi:hypothetical protein
MHSGPGELGRGPGRGRTRAQAPEGRVTGRPGKARPRCSPPERF